MQVYILLHDIRSIHNVGSIFRTADAAGVSKIFLTGYTPTPIDRFGRTVKELSKVALGGENSVAWEYFKDPVGLIKSLKKIHNNKLQIIALEQNKNSVNYKKIKLNKKQPVLFIVGNEVEGVSKKLLKLSDVIAEIPMKGKKESLNVSVATGILLFQVIQN